MGFAAGELDEFAGLQGFDLRQDLVIGEGLAAGEGVLGVAPGATEIAAGQTHEDAGDAREGALSLHGLVELDETEPAHGVAGLRLRRDVQIGDGLGQDFKHGSGELLVVAGKAGVGFEDGAVLDAHAA